MNTIYIDPFNAHKSESTFDTLEFNSFGLKRICYHTNGSQEMQVMELQCEPHSIYPAHFHDHEEVIQVLAGELLVEKFNQSLISTELVKLNQPFQLEVIPRGQIHMTYTNQMLTRYMEYKCGPISDQSTILAKET
jgi:hypothetical protein